MSDETENGETNLEIYHERQHLELCALHVLNNLFQDKAAFTKKDLDDICVLLSPEKFINPHRSMLGLGNYDVNVIMAAIHQKNMATVWFDKRKDVHGLVLENIHGLIMNIPSDFGLGFIKLPFKRKHWYAIKKLNGFFYNLDSKLRSPEKIGSESDVMDLLEKELCHSEKELLLIVTPEVEASGMWLKSDSSAAVT